MDYISLGRKLKASRAKCGWNINTCASHIGISANYLSTIERGNKVPKFETFVNILNVLTASADEVLQDSLVVGYQAKSNAVLKELQSLDPAKQKQALDIFDFVIQTLKNG